VDFVLARPNPHRLKPALLARLHVNFRFICYFGSIKAVLFRQLS